MDNQSLSRTAGSMTVPTCKHSLGYQVLGADIHNFFEELTESSVTDVSEPIALACARWIESARALGMYDEQHLREAMLIVAELFDQQNVTSPLASKALELEICLRLHLETLATH